MRVAQSPLLRHCAQGRRFETDPRPVSADERGDAQPAGHPGRVPPEAHTEAFTRYGAVVAGVSLLLRPPYLWLRYFVLP